MHLHGGKSPKRRPISPAQAGVALIRGHLLPCCEMNMFIFPCWFSKESISPLDIFLFCPGDQNTNGSLGFLLQWLRENPLGSSFRFLVLACQKPILLGSVGDPFCGQTVWQGGDSIYTIWGPLTKLPLGNLEVPHLPPTQRVLIVALGSFCNGHRGHLRADPFFSGPLRIHLVAKNQHHG